MDIIGIITTIVLLSILYWLLIKEMRISDKEDKILFKVLILLTTILILILLTTVFILIN